jgi:hypothetical protein
MAIAPDPKQIVLNDELLLSQVISQEAIIRLACGKENLHRRGILGNGERGES